jgi:uncharacterized protein (TIGR03118 family)
MRPFARSWWMLLAGAALGALALAPATYADDPAYQVRNLVSDVPGRAEHTDPNLVNAWGIAFNPFGFVWVTDNGTGLSTLYDGNGVAQSLVVSIPGGKPTGIVYNGSNEFVVTKGGVSGPARFIFASEAGIISAWAPNVDPTHAIVVADNSSAEAIYKGLALGSDGTRFLLYATDFHNRRIDVFDSKWHPTTVPGGFADPSVPGRYGPFGIQNLNGGIYVTYARQDSEREDDVPGRGEGLVNVFSGSGSLVRRIAKGGPLNAPWGLALAPPDFGVFANLLLIGNFGDGVINAFDQGRGRFVGALSTADRKPIVIPGLWAIAFGNGILSQPTSTLFFAAGPDDEEHGLYGRIDVSPPSQ